MPGLAFVKFQTYAAVAGKDFAPGESQTTGHHGDTGWIDISDWSFDVEAEASHLKGTGAAVGKPTFNALSITHYYDKSSPTIMQYIVRGNHFKTVTLHLLKQTGGDKPELFYELVLQDAFISKVGNSGGDDGAVSQTVEMVYKQIVMGYKPQNNNGTLGSMKPFKWNVGVMNQTTDVQLTIK